MPTYTAPLDNFRFVLNDVLQVGDVFANLGLTDATPDLLDAVIEEAGKFCENELQPLNLSGDTEGCTCESSSSKALTRLDFPAPLGAATTKRFPG